MAHYVSRRELLKSGSALVVSFAFGAALPRSLAAQTGQSRELGKLLDPREVDSFLAVYADGSVTVYTGKVDLGTGLRIAVRQMVAEELGLPIGRVSLVEGDTGLTPDQGGTGGSSGLTGGGVAVRQAAATARQALLALGADELKRPATELTLVDGQVRPKAGGPGVSIGALIGGKRFSLKVDPQAPRQDPKTYAVVGQPILRPDVPGKCTGEHVYVQDFTLPNLLHGRVVRPPTIGATLVSVDESSIRQIPDVRIVRDHNFLGVVAKNEWAAVRAARELKATWSDWQGLPGSDAMESYIRAGAIDRDQIVVDTRTVPMTDGPSGSRVAVPTPRPAVALSATYYWPNQSHASLGPSCAVADVRDGGATVWTASQATHALRGNIAKVFGLSSDKVRVVYLDGPGCYGGNGNDDAAADAVLLSKAVGQPVRVQWMRQEELAWDPKGPQQLLDVRAGLDADGNIIVWDLEMWVPTARPGARPLLAAESAGLAQDNGQNSGALTQNADPPYPATNVRVTAHLLKDTPLRPSNLRAPGKIANVFAVEIDDRRTRGGGAHGPARVPTARDDGPARDRRAQARDGHDRMADAHVAQSAGGARHDHDGPRSGVRALQASRKLRRDRDGGRGRSNDRCDRGPTRDLRPRLRARRQPRRPSQSG